MDAEKQSDRKVAEARRVSELMRDLIHVLRARFEDEFRDAGVTLAQLRLLKAVGQQSERSAASLARECHVTPQTLHTMLARAVREGWIVRGSSDRNHRFVTASLTPQGQALLQRGSVLREQTEAQMWEGTPAKVIRQTRRTLEAALANLDRKPSPPPVSGEPHPKA